MKPIVSQAHCSCVKHILAWRVPYEERFKSASLLPFQSRCCLYVDSRHQSSLICFGTELCCVGVMRPFFSSVKLCFKFVELYSEFFLLFLLVSPPFCYTKSLVALPHRTSKKISITNRRFARLTLLNLTGILHGRHSSATEFSSALLSFYLQRHSSLVTQHKKERRILESQLT